METAINLSKKSKCVSKQVGCVLVKDNRIISMGYNGTPSGYPEECNKIFDKNNFDREEHHKWSNLSELHGEINVILHAVKNGISTNGCTLYSTLHPCDQCMKNLSQSGILKIIYLNEYDKATSNNKMKDFLKTTMEIIKFSELEQGK